MVETTLIPVVIGVTGHRDLREEDYGHLEKAINTILEEMIERYPSTPLVLLTPLAEGADRLAAKAALKLGIHLIAPLPMPVEEYIKDFQTEGSVEDFENLLARVEEYYVLPAHDTGDNHEDLDRVESYTRTGAYIVNHSQILIALWDGVENGLLGGTAHTVRCKLEGLSEKYRHFHGFLDCVDQGPVYHIITPRISNPRTDENPFSLKKHFPRVWENDKQASEYYHQLLTRIDTYNKELLIHIPLLAPKVTNSMNQVIPDEKAKKLPSHLLAIREQYAAADVLAQVFQKKRIRTMKNLFIIGILSLFFFELYAHVFPHTPWVLLFYPAVIGVAFVQFRKAQRGQYQNKHLEYRALAEGLRVQLFWEMIGLDDLVADHYLHRQQSEMGWIRYALRTLSIRRGLLGKPNKTAGGEIDKYRLVLDYWLQDQTSYYNSTYQKNENSENNQNQYSKRIFIGGLIFACLWVVINGIFPNTRVLEMAHTPALMIIVLSAAAAAALEGYSEKMALPEQVKQYYRMSLLFNECKNKYRLLLEQGDFDNARNLVHELGTEALRESGDWLMMHRERPMKVPISA
ncbi:MAG: hypothetical protein ABFD04_13495 [Syntrophomonas sp.]